MSDVAHHLEQLAEAASIPRGIDAVVEMWTERLEAGLTKDDIEAMRGALVGIECIADCPNARYHARHARSLLQVVDVGGEGQ